MKRTSSRMNNKRMPYRRKYGSNVLTRTQSSAVRKLVTRQQELKYITGNSAASVTVSTTAVISGVLFDVAQGNTDVTRIGDRLTWAGHMDLAIEVMNGSGASGRAYNNSRFIIFQWFPNQTPIATDLLLLGVGGVNPDIYSQYNHDRRSEYLVLFDKCFKTVGSGASASNPAVSNASTGVLDFNISLAKARKDVQFVGTGITGTNRFYTLHIGDSSAGTLPTIHYSIRTVYRDG